MNTKLKVNFPFRISFSYINQLIVTTINMNFIVISRSGIFATQVLDSTRSSVNSTINGTV